MTSTTEKPLNRAEVWIAEHAVPVFIVIAVLILLGAIAVFVTYEQQTGTADKVHVLQPQVTKINKSLCDEASLKDVARARRCAERIRIGLINCRHSQSCQAAYLALATFPQTVAPGRPATEPSPGSATTEPGGGDAHQSPPNHGHQPPGPVKGPNPPSETPPATPPGQEQQNPGEQHREEHGPQNAGKPSGVGVEVCLVETCAGAHVGVGTP